MFLLYIVCIECGTSIAHLYNEKFVFLRSRSVIGRSRGRVRFWEGVVRFCEVQALMVAYVVSNPFTFRVIADES